MPLECRITEPVYELRRSIDASTCANRRNTREYFLSLLCYKNKSPQAGALCKMLFREGEALDATFPNAGFIFMASPLVFKGGDPALPDLFGLTRVSTMDHPVCTIPARKCRQEVGVGDSLTPSRFVVHALGFEPRTARVSVECSTN